MPKASPPVAGRLLSFLCAGMDLVEIGQDGALSAEAGPLPDVARSAVESTVQLYSKVGWSRPWIGYLALEGGACVGTCAFTHAPRDGVVEIAYFTFPGGEGRGVATRMAGRLVSLARASAPEVSITAHTLPHENASTRVLRKLGFLLVGPAVHEMDGQIWVWRMADTAPDRPAPASTPVPAPLGRQGRPR
jgi:[ribosomal protein S5]-alanine N-acetyltransferase